MDVPQTVALARILDARALASDQVAFLVRNKVGGAAAQTLLLAKCGCETLLRSTTCRSVSGPGCFFCIMEHFGTFFGEIYWSLVVAHLIGVFFEG
jgi:hypothetical protein